MALVFDPIPGASPGDSSPPGPNGAPPIPTSVPVREPGGNVAPVLGGAADPPGLVFDAPNVVDPETGLTVGRSAPPIGPPVTDPEQDAKRHAALLQFSMANIDSNPEVARYAARTGLAPDFVEANLDQVKRQSDAAGTDWENFARHAPLFATFVRDNPSVPLRMAAHDLDKVGVIERAVTGPYWAFVDAIHQQEEIRPREFAIASGSEIADALPEGPVKDSLRMGAGMYQAEVDELKKQWGGEGGYGSTTAFGEGMDSFVGMVPFLAGDLGARGVGGFVGGAASGAAGAVATAPVAGVGGVLTGLGGVGAGSTMGSFLFNYYEAKGPAYQDISKLRDKAGQPLEPWVVNTATEVSSLLQASLMAVPGGALFKKMLPGGKVVAARVAEDLVTKALLQDTAAMGALKVVSNWAHNMAHGGLLMAANAAAAAMGQELAKGVSGKDVSADWSNVARAGYEGMIAGLKMMLVGAAYPAMADSMEAAGRAQQAREGYNRLVAMTDRAPDIEWWDKVPEQAQDYVRRTKEEKGAAQAAYVPVEQLNAYAQAKRIDPEKFVAAINEDGGEAHREAMKTGGDVVFPIERWLAKAKAPHVADLQMDTKLYPDAQTPRESIENRERLRKVVEQQAKAWEANPENLDDKERLRKFLQDQMRENAGLSKTEAEANADLLTNGLANLAARNDVHLGEAVWMSPELSMAKYGKDGRSRLSPGALDQLAQITAQPAAREIAQKLSTMEPETFARSVFLDQNAGLPNERAALEVPADGPTSHVSVEGVKYTNDLAGHGKADLLYRAAADALNEVAPGSVFKRGGDFEVRGPKTDAELQDLLAKANAKMKERGLEGFDLTGRTGDTYEAAGEAHQAFKDQGEAAGTRAKPRAYDEAGEALPNVPPEKPLGVKGDVKTMSFPTKRTFAEVPEKIQQRLDAIPKGPEGDAQRFNEAYRTPEGTLTAEGWKAIARKPHVVALDAAGLRAVNKNLGKEAGDRMIAHIRKIATAVGGSSFDFAHLSGDEFAFQSHDAGANERYLAKLRDALHTVGVELTGPDGVKEEGYVRLWHGITDQGSYEAADRDLSERKTAAKAKGEGPPGPDPAGVEAGADHGERGGDLQGWRDRLERGAAGQDYPGTRPREGQAPEVANADGETVTLRQDPNEPGEPRGQIEFTHDAEGRPNAADVRMFAGKDKSTFAHEIGHFLGWAMHNLATSAVASDSLRADYKTLLDFAGFESPEARQRGALEHQELARTAKDRPGDVTDENRAREKDLAGREEKISHAWEAYLLEGRAPSLELARTFGRFRDWMLAIYKGGLPLLQNQYRQNYGTDLVVSDEVRSVFDRLLATDEAKQAAQRQGAGVTEDPAAVAKMTPPQLERYRKKLSDAAVRADLDLARKAVDIDKESLEAAREKHTQRAQQDVDAQPIYRAQRFLQDGEMVNVLGEVIDTPEPLLVDGKPMKLNRGDFLKKYGADVLRQMPRRIFDKRKSKGVSAEEAAPHFGFDSGDDMVKKFAENPTREQAIEQKVQGAMAQEFGPRAEQFKNAAVAAAHNEDSIGAVLEANRALAADLDPRSRARVNATTVQTLKAFAKEAVAKTTLADADAGRYERAERQYALEASRLDGKGDKEGAAQARELRVTNQALFMEARDRVDSLEKAKQKNENLSEKVRGDLGKASPVYRSAHDALTAAVAVETLGARAEDQGVVDELVRTAEDNGHLVGFDEVAIRKLIAQPRAWDSLTVEEAENVANAWASIRHFANADLSVEVAGKKQAIQDVLQNIATRTASIRPAARNAVYREKTAGLKDQAVHFQNSASALLQNMETLVQMLDGSPSEGPARDLFINSYLESQQREVGLTKDVLDRVRKSWGDVPKEIRKLRNKTEDVGHLLPRPGEADPRYTRSYLWSLFLNMGNEGNLQRLRDGNGWDEANMLEAVSRLSHPELEFLQGLRDTFDHLHPALAEAYEKRTGLKLDKVEATPLVVNGVEYRGGYFPIKYDRQLAAQGERQDISSIKDLFPAATPPIVSSGHTKARLDRVPAPIDLTWEVVPQHLSAVIRDLAFGDWVRDVARVIMKPRAVDPNGPPTFDQTARTYLGPERAAEFVPWLRDVAAGRIDSLAGVESDLVRKGGSFLRSRFYSASLLLNFPSHFRHLFDPWTTIADRERVPGFRISTSYLKVIGGGWSDPAFKDSKQLAYREASYRDNLRKQLGEIEGSKWSPAHRAAEVGHGLSHWVDAFTTRVAFKAAYDHAFSTGATHEEAVAQADRVVDRSFPSFNVAEKPPILRTRAGVAAALTMWTYAAKMQNLRSQAADDLLRTLHDPEATAGDKAGKTTAVAVSMLSLGVIAVAGSYVRGHGPKRDEVHGTSGWAEWVAREIALSPMDDWPLVGPFAKAVIEGQRPNEATAPELAAMYDIMTRYGRAMGKPGTTWGYIESIVALLTGAHGFAHRTVGAAGKIATGAHQPNNVFNAAGDLIYGIKKNEEHDPLHDIGGLAR